MSLSHFNRYLALFLLCVAATAAPALADPASSAAEDVAAFAKFCREVEVSPDGGRVVCADIAAVEQTLVYNRFGSFDPEGMIFALRRDLAPMDRAAGVPGESDCDAALGTETGGGATEAGKARLRDCKRPRPLTLRANVGDLLLVRVTNLLRGDQPDLSENFCREAGEDRGRAAVRAAVAEGGAERINHGEAECGPKQGDAADWPATRGVNFVAQGLMPLPLPGESEPNPACTSFGAAEPGKTFACLYAIPEEGTYFVASHAAPAGGEGDGGSITHGLFGAILAERPGTRWYRGQVSRGAFDAVWPVWTRSDGAVPRWGDPDFIRHRRSAALDYEATDGKGVPILNMAMPLDGTPQRNFRSATRLEIVHNDLNAIIYCDEAAYPYSEDAARAPLAKEACARAKDATTPPEATVEPAYRAFREFSVFFHDELKTVFTRNFRELGEFGQLAGVRDGFAINYGSSGMGAALLANRKGIGPAAGCAECLYEEFFLTSWANGDPALLEWFPDDPSNVHHSYLNDPVVFRNFHAGPKETHVFHLHAHQWFAGNDPSRGGYLDSQTVGPRQGFTYNIYHGGFGAPGAGGWGSGGSGNRNDTVGDSIFHCHLYPHFAQGMWELWRVHDVLEDGTRRLPDGQAKPGLSLDIRSPEEIGHKRPGSVDRETGVWLGSGSEKGTPIPALVPLPGEALPLLPTYAARSGSAAMASGADEKSMLDKAPPPPPTEVAQGPSSAMASTADPTPTPMPGFPFYVAGQPGHRPPQAPNDIARALSGGALGEGTLMSGGIGRHVVGTAEHEAGTPLPARAKEEEARLTKLLAAEPGAGSSEAEKAAYRTARSQLEALRRQVVAKALALGDMSGELTRAKITELDGGGERLERAAMGFHHDGRLEGPGTPLDLRDPSGQAVAMEATTAPTGRYPTRSAPLPGSPAIDLDGWFRVNGAPPAPGAPFANPCGMAPGRPGAVPGKDPLTGSLLGRDPHVIGFRRYEVSAVQLDLIVNQAGWHDPQARINVLSAEADGFKDQPGTKDRISPAIRDDEEPFFFRALSGECIEFRHTNELPKDLALDDFQVKTPTDTIGQHIHLVKFDVTASDGSGNGWNYEDGTFAADELATRLCAWARSGDAVAVARVAEMGERVASALAKAGAGETLPGGGFCAWRPVVDHTVWRLKRSDYPFLFQTTAQRWFADPILSKDESRTPRDRTMRTIFTHDHFGPSSIQQHGFYSALLIEPAANPATGTTLLRGVCAPDGKDCAVPLTDPLTEVAAGDRQWVGAAKRVFVDGQYPVDNLRKVNPIHGDYREYALSIADFALLYDPRDRESEQEMRAAAGTSGEKRGMARLACEAFWRWSPLPLEEVCGVSGVKRDGVGWFIAGNDLPPAWIAGGTHRDDLHRGDYPAGDLFLPGEARALETYLIDYRRKAAGRTGGTAAEASLAKPVAPPERPESISVDHHDPYLVNYRGAPIPLRVADKAPGQRRFSADCAPKAMDRPRNGGVAPKEESPVEAALAKGTFGDCSATYQMRGESGDMSHALMSARPDAWGPPRRGEPVNRDPETPILEAYQGERIVTRMIQGAQEVQHNFRVAGLGHPRNMDQPFSQGMRDRAVTAAYALDAGLRRACFDAVRLGRPADYEKWRETTSGGVFPSPEQYWKKYETALAECDNIEGYVFSQEIGISEHFEMRGRLRADVQQMEFVPSAPPPPARGKASVISDYLYDFGSVDAIWNGAWGLARIYKDGSADDPSSSAATKTAISARLGQPLYEQNGAEGVAASPAPLAFGPDTPGCPLPGGAQGAVVPTREAVIVAIATRDVRDAKGKAVWPKGTEYGGGRYDPDGLMLALLEPSDLVEGGIAAPKGWNSLAVAKVSAKVAERYAGGSGGRPEPFVMRVEAGDCVVLRYVNLLRAQPGGGMIDHLGDALAPKIAPLNLDPIRETEENKGPTGVLVRPDGPIHGLRPSADLALSIGLPRDAARQRLRGRDRLA